MVKCESNTDEENCHFYTYGNHSILHRYGGWYLGGTRSAAAFREMTLPYLAC